MNNRKSIIISCIFLGLFFFVSFKTKTSATLNTFKISGFAQGTSYHITYYAGDSVVLKNQVDSLLDRIDSSLSVYKTYSLISKFNRSKKGVKIDDYLRVVVDKSLEIYKNTRGVSDITVYPLVNCWGFGPAKVSKMPEAATIRSILPCIGASKIHLRGKFLLKDIPCTKIDVNGIAQGYSVDLVANFLEGKGIQHYLVEIGGELKIKGRRQPNGTMMQIGLEAPAPDFFDKPVVEKIIHLDQGAITTSGNYRKYTMVRGKFISHLINPKTGYPFQNELISVTVWAKDAITADGYDNALMGMGLSKSFSFLKHHKELEAYFIYRDKQGVVKDTATTGFYSLINN
ncbi:MAG: FAD:protein FMN transferase [Chitinophagaceae bacterium]